MSTSGSKFHTWRVGALALAIACTLPLAAARADDGRTKGVLQWQSGHVSTPAQSADQIAQAVDTARAAVGQRVIVQLDRPLDDNLRATLDLGGVKLLSYVGDNAFFARIDTTRASGAAIAAVPDIRCVLPIQRNWKLHPDVVTQNFPDYSVITRAKANAAVGDEKPGASDTEVVVAAYVMFHPDVNLNDGMRLARVHGAAITDIVSPVNSIVIEIPAENLAALADEDAVQWIEPPLPGFSEVNDSNRARVGADTVQAPPYGLDGTGVTALVYDGGKIRTTHQDLTPRVTIGPNDATSTADHATHVAGTIGGTGAASAGLRKGMAPAVTFISFAFEMAGGLQQGFLYTFPGDIAQDYGWAIANGADIANNSIGTNTVPNGYPCEWEGNYGITDTLIDTIVRGTGTDPNYPQFNTPFRVVWANGNERQGTRCNDPNVPAGYHLTAPPACAKNHITVGALNSNDDSMTSFSSWGPADDGRMKPDISAPGCQSNDDTGVTSCSSSGDAAYGVKCGTSMACPTTVGVGSLILQDYRQQFPGAPDFRNSTLKTILAHTAADVFEVGPDYKSGYGSIRAEPAIQLVRAGNFLENTISGTGALFTATVVVGPGQAPLKVTLAWDDVPGTPNVNPVLVNDLDLRVFDAQNNQYYPWTLAGLANPAAPAVRTQANHLDNIEQVVIDAPTPGGYRVEVYGFNVPQGPQPFSLTATPLLVNCSSQGTASLDRPKYPCTSTATARVIDCDLNTSDLVIDTVTVNIKSTTDPNGLSVLLTEVAPEAATFVGSVGLNTTGGSGVLQVAPGDTVTLTYNDADNGSGNPAVVTANASIDCTGPVISNVAINPINPRDATVTFNTNESAKVTIRYGLACGSLDQAKIVGGYRTAHSVVLDGLQDNTTYFFAVDAEDEAGNQTTDNNGGACYTFATPEVPDFFTEDFQTAPANDLDNLSLIWTPVGGVDFYDLCIEQPLMQLPNDPNAGQTFAQAFTDDSFRTINLSGGFTVRLYGVSYSTVHVGSNGYLTFTAGDTDYLETLADHFDTPRISACFDDLNPTQGSGRITYQQLSDRLVVSFVNVPEHNVANSPNTFQYELFGDGMIKLHFLTVSAADGIAGLSAGNGLSPDFYESDLTEYGSCGPRPPFAVGQAAQTAVNTNVNITLQATDDGLPNPPGAITYVIASLPSQGRLIDPGAGVILVAPHVLVGGGNIVTYDPPYNFQGATSFTFKANDGGVPPEGGDSAPATVAVTVGGPQVVYSFPLDTNPGWSVQDQWAFGQPTGASAGSGRDPNSGFTGVNVYGFNLNGGYPNNMSQTYYLTTTPLDFTNITQVSLRFRRWLGIESATYDHANIQISTNGTTWTDVWNHTGSTLNELAWSQQVYALPAADGQAAVRIRWGMGPTDTSVVYQGWNIDDIEFWGLVPIGPAICLGDANCDGIVDFFDIDPFVGLLGCPGAGVCDGECPWQNGDIDENGVVDFYDIDPFVGLLGTTCP